MSTRDEPMLSTVQLQAESIASKRHEPLSRIHFLAALGAQPCTAGALLERFELSPRRLLAEVGRVGAAEGLNLVQLGARARDVARRFGARAPGASHLLLTILNDPGDELRALFERFGTDLHGLRSELVKTLPALPERSAPSRPVSSHPLAGRANASASPTAPLVVPRPAPPSPFAAPAVRSSGQALSVVPDVGPTPLPGRWARPIPSDVPSKTSLDADTLGEVARVSRAALGAGPLGADAVDESVDSGGRQAASTLDRFRLDPKKFPILTSVGRNLTLLAELGEIDPVVGRTEEIERALDILAKRQSNSPCLIGPAGVGKTSVARGIAAALAAAAGEEPPRLLVEIPIAELFAGTGVRGALAGRLSSLKREVRASEGRVVLFFDEIHQLFVGEASEEIASDLKLALSRGELPCVGATSGEEFRRVIEKDPAIMRSFSAVELEEPSREDAFLILDSVSERLSRHHRVTFDEEALATSIAWSLRYLPGRALPDKAVSILDLAGARCRRRGKTTVSVEAVADVVAGLASMPIERLLESDSDRMLALEDILAERVIGHEEEIRKIARILRRNAAGLGGRRPIGTFLLLGPTGVGKTETAKAIAEVLFHSESAMTRIDMAEMSEAHSVSKLVGAPPGYVGHDAGGMLTEAVRRRPYQVLLLDEIEKAHPEVLTAFLAVFDEGRMTDSRGRLVDFTNSVIILTSNLGASEARATSRKRVGFGAESRADESDAGSKVVHAARGALPPELYNRLDEVLAFSPLTKTDVSRIAVKLIRGLAGEVFESRGIRLEVEPEAIDVLLESGGFDPELGARPLRRALARLVEAPLAEAILQGDVLSGETYRVGAECGKLTATVSGDRQRAAE